MQNSVRINILMQPRNLIGRTWLEIKALLGQILMLSEALKNPNN